jgi:hypothetical protein
MARSRNHCCRGNATLRTLCIVVGLHVGVNNIPGWGVFLRQTDKQAEFILCFV